MKNILYAFYDFSVAPATFDVAVFLFRAEMARKRAGCEAIHLVIVPGAEKGFLPGQFDMYRKLGANEYQFDIMRWRLTNIVIPMGWLLPSCRSVTICSSRDEAQCFEKSLVQHSFPVGYKVSAPTRCHEISELVKAGNEQCLFSSSVEPSLQALSFVDRWMKKEVGNRKLVTLTLRECDYEMSRNSNVDQWLAFASELDKSIYTPVFIRDMDKVFTPVADEFEGFCLFHEAVWNLGIRAAIYHRSYLNMMVANGPGGLCMFNHKTRVQIFYKRKACGAANYSYIESQGLPVGGQYSFMSPLQKVVWDDDDLPVLRQSFAWMSERIDKFMGASFAEISNIFDGWITEEKYSDAEWLASLAVERFPEKTEAWLLKSKVLRLAGEPSEALNAVNKAAEINETPQGLDELQAIAKAMGREAEADTIAAYRQRTYS